jgi:fumarate reductase subunit D
MKRSRAPIFWLLFGAGGMLSALFGAALVFVTGIAAPLGWPPASDPLTYPHALALSRGVLLKGIVFVVIALFAWHAAHRIFHSLHDLGFGRGAAAKAACYGGALALTIVTALALLATGF